MAKRNEKAKRGRGRPKLAFPLTVRMLIRMDTPTGDAIKKFAAKFGDGRDATAARMILMERLRSEGFLK